MPSKYSNQFSNQIKRYRHQRHLRLRDVSYLGDFGSPAPLSNWEKGRKLPSLTNALKLSAAIGCPVELLFKEEFNHYQDEVLIRKQSINNSNHDQSKTDPFHS
jgi:transcriptional regulator with XRE-family HTH domain